MNWRNVGAGEGSDLPSPASVIACHSQIDMSPSCRSHFYDSPNLRLLPGLGDSNEWFEYLKEKKLRTYFVRAATTICAFAVCKPADPWPLFVGRMTTPFRLPIRPRRRRLRSGTAA